MSRGVGRSKTNQPSPLISGIEAGAPTLFWQEKPLKTPFLLHTCCAPCAEWPLFYLLSHGVKPHTLFYNPNIHPQSEWQRRAESYQTLVGQYGLESTLIESVQEARWRAFPKDQKRLHCGICYVERLRETAKQAALQGLSGFSTTLLVSPYQDRERLLQVGEALAKQYGIHFYPFDFRPGFQLGQKVARQRGYYRQQHCGCIYSLAESTCVDKIVKRLALDPQTLPEPRT